MRKQSNPTAGFYVDSTSEYDIRHFVGKRANTKPNIQRVITALNADAAEKGEPAWRVAWADRKPGATFMVLRRDK
jgi:hypothetical protein